MQTEEDEEGEAFSDPVLLAWLYRQAGTQGQQQQLFQPRKAAAMLGWEN